MSLVQLIDPSSIQVSPNESLLSQIVAQVVHYLSVLSKHPALVISDANDRDIMECSDEYWEDIVGTLSHILKQILSAVKSHNEKLSAQPDPATQGQVFKPSVDQKVFERLCDIILTTQFKSRVTLRAVKAIFTDIQNFGDDTIAVQTLFRESLSGSLRRFVEVIEGDKISIELLKREVTVINSILKFAKASTNSAD